MFSIISGLAHEQLQNGQQDLFAKVGAIQIGERLVLTSKMTEKHDDLHENDADVKRRCDENVLGETVLRT